MGADHAIIVGYGYRIPISKWEEFKAQLHNRQLRSKKVKIYRDTSAARPKQTTLTGEIASEESENSSYDETFIDADWEINAIEGHNERPTTHGFETQGYCAKNGEEGYVFIYDRSLPCEYLIDRKIGGAMSWMCNQFEHMQNVETLNFSIQLDHEFGDWKLKSGKWHEETQQRKDFIDQLSPVLKEFIETLPVKDYYNRWLFSYAC